MSDLPNCPACASEFTYDDGLQFVCPECGHEWSKGGEEETESASSGIRDANGNPLVDGDTVTVIKDLKVKGSSLVLKIGTKAVIKRRANPCPRASGCTHRRFTSASPSANGRSETQPTGIPSLSASRNAPCGGR